MDLEKPSPTSATRYEVLQNRHFDEAVKCLTSQFINGNPLIKALDISEEEYVPFVRVRCQEAIVLGLSVAAVDAETGKLQGLMIYKDLEVPFAFHAESLCPKLTPLFEMIEQMGHRYRSAHSFQKGETIENCLIGVDRKYVGQGMSQGMFMKGVQIWLKKGYSRVVARLGHGAIQQMFLTLPGASVFETLAVQEFEYQGQKPFCNVTEMKSFVLAQMELKALISRFL